MDEPVRALDVTRAFIGDLTLTFDVQDAESGEWSKVSYVVSGDLDIETMIAMLAIEERIQQSEAVQDLLTHLYDARVLIEQIVAQRNPDAVIPKLSPRQINRAFSWLVSGGQTDIAVVADEVTSALASGFTPSDVEDETVGAGAVVGEEPTEDDGPLASEKPSDEPSSSSETTTDGGRSGGEESPGVSSVSTSTQPTPV